MKSTRDEVYEAIDSERNYQDSRWGHTLSDGRQSPDGKQFRSHDEYSAYILRYALALNETCSTTDNPTNKRDIVRKIAGLAVACMEQNGAVKRQ